MSRAHGEVALPSGRPLTPTGPYLRGQRPLQKGPASLQTRAARSNLAYTRAFQRVKSLVASREGGTSMSIGASVVSQILGQLAISSFRVVCSTLAEEDGSEPSLPWAVAVKDHSGDIVGILSGDQAADVADFLRSADVASLCQADFLCRLGQPENYSLEDLRTDIREAFANLARKWCSSKSSDWSSLAEDIWSEVEAHMDEALPADAVLAHLAQSDLTNFKNQMGADPSHQKSEGGVPKFLRDLVNLSLNLQRLGDVRDNVFDIKKQFAEYYDQIRLEHAQHDYRIKIDELYVARNLLDWATGTHVTSSDIFSSTFHARVVVTGDPGAGKSTFTEYLIWTLVNQPDATNVTPLVINCREYAVARETDIFTIIRDKLASTLHIRFTDQDIEDILILGRAYFVVDGVDEILDLGRRRQLIKTIEMLAGRFPLCPIIATTRNIGYEQARFDTARFRRYELSPFNESQIQEYVSRWFSLTARTDTDVDRFLGELESIPDLRSNPLMLSLLCILYRARGHIPRNRRQIYSQCADLLFNRWDQMRHIEQPYDHQHYGDELMQEIATWFYNSQAAQAGLEEQQIRKVISLFLIDTAAVAPVEAEKRAGAFLDFCADRAWLLGSAGLSERGQRLFVFTHRTFMEFFAAESLARGPDSGKLVAEVAKSYDRDASSVLPDLIVQSAEVHRKGGARDIITGLFELDRKRPRRDSGHYLPLCLRIINLSPVSPRLMEQIFERLFNLWDSKDATETRLSLIAVLDMYRDPRNRFKELLKNDIYYVDGGQGSDNESHPLVQFLIRWANLYLIGGASAYLEEWGEFVDESVERLLPHLKKSQNVALRHFLFERGYLEPEAVLLKDLVATAFDEIVPGYAMESIYRILSGAPAPGDSWVIEQLAEYGVKGTKVSGIFAQALDDALHARFESRPTAACADMGESVLQNLAPLLLWLGCVAYEPRSLMSGFHDMLGDVLELDFARFCENRDYYLDKGVGAAVRGVAISDDDEDEGRTRRPMAKEDLAEAVKSRPAWFAKWCNGRRTLIS